MVNGVRVIDPVELPKVKAEPAPEDKVVVDEEVRVVKEPLPVVL